MTQKHSILPPSGASAWSLCPLWALMNAQYPENNTAESEEGTAAHWVLGSVLVGSVPQEDSLAPNGQVVTLEMIEGARMVAELVPMDLNPQIEETVSILAIHPECFGTPDVWWVDGDTLHILDYKFGHRFVDEYWNKQGLLYMVGIAGKLDTDKPIKKVSFTIVQPRCYYRGEPVRTHTYQIEQAREHLAALREAATRATQPNPMALTGPQCEHCPGRHACPTLQKAAYSDAETSTDQQPVELSPSAAALELRMLERALLRLTARVEGLREQTLVNLKAGEPVPHYKLENGRSRKVWKVSPEEVAALGKVLGKKLTVPKVVTPSQAAALFLDESIIARYSHSIEGAVRLAECNDSEAAKVFKK